MIKAKQPTKEELPKLETFFLHYASYDDAGYYCYEIKEDIEKAKAYFEGKNRSYVFPSELEALIALLYYQKVDENNITDVLFSDVKEKKDDPVLDELNRNYSYLYTQIKEKHQLNFSLYLWTIYKTYWYFREKNENDVIEKPSFSLLNHLLDLCFLVFNYVEINKANKCTDKESVSFAREVCSLMSNDLLQTIINRFPTYYDPIIMFVGYGCHIPAGCCDLTVNMKSFDKFIKEINNYDYWSDYQLKGDEMIDKLGIEMDYDKLEKEVFTNDTSSIS